MSLGGSMITRDFKLVGCDTDGIAFKKGKQGKWLEGEADTLVQELNALMPKLIEWGNDGVVPKQLVIKTKNYVLVDAKGKIEVKGSALKATMKEPALQQFTREAIELLLDGTPDQLIFLYIAYVCRIKNITDISDWCSKKTVTKAVLNGQHTTQVQVRNAIGSKEVQEGDKLHMFYSDDNSLCLRENFTGQYDMDRLLDKLHACIVTFDTVIDTSVFPNFSLKRNKARLDRLTVL
jgi:DNA polymerase elongation subunit (family B)